MSRVEVIEGSTVEIASSYRELSFRAAVHIADVVRSYTRQVPTILWPEGNTQKGVKPALAKELARTFKVFRLCNLDEYCVPDETDGFRLIDEDDSQSFRGKTKRELLSLPGLRDKGINHYYPDERNIERWGRYDLFLYGGLGGVALTVDGLGEDGHIMGFNQPGTPRDSVTRLVHLNESLRVNNQAKYQAGPVPAEAVTVGVNTCLRSDYGITLVSGAHKAEALRRALTDDVSADFPATYWQLHPNHLWLVDMAAASLLKKG